MRRKKLSARVLSLVLTAAMVGTMLPATVFATEGDVALGASSIETTTRTITAFDELGGDYTKSVPFDGHTYALTVKLGTPIEEIVLPTELGVTVEKTTTTTTPPVKDEVQDSGEAPKDEVTSDEPAAQAADTDTTVSDNEPAASSDAEAEPVSEDKPDAENPPAHEQESSVTTVTEETIPVTWKGDKAYTPDQNSKVIYTPVLPEGYTVADGIKLPTIYVMVGMQARAAAIASGTSGTCSWDITDGVLTIKPTSGATGVMASFFYGGNPPWLGNRADITKAVVESGVKTAVAAANMFSNLPNCTEIDITNLDTSDTTDMSGMFFNAAALPSITFGDKFDTSKVTNMSSMFSGCRALTTLDVSKFNTAVVTDMSTMFSGCIGLTSLSLTNFVTTNVANMYNMFSNCTGLTSLDLSKFNTAKVTKMTSMFNMSSGLTELDLSSFDTSAVLENNMAYMFEACNGLESIKFGANFNKTVPLPKLALTGQRFDGWYKDDFTTQVAPASGGDYANPEGTTIYSKWTSLVPIITFDTCNSEVLGNAKTTVGGKITPPTPKDWNGYTFAGWYRGIDGTGEAVTASTVHFASTKVYAKWIATNGKTVRTESLDLTGSVTPALDQGWTWADNTLTLDGATIDCSGYSATEVNVNFNAIALPGGATIQLAANSTNTVKSGNVKGPGNTYAVDAKGALTIDGTGSLNATTGKITYQSNYGYAIYAIGALTIDNGTVNATAFGSLADVNTNAGISSAK